MYTITDGSAVLMKVANRHSLWRDYAVKVIDKTRSSMEPFYVQSSKYIYVYICHSWYGMKFVIAQWMILYTTQ